MRNNCDVKVSLMVLVLTGMSLLVTRNALAQIKPIAEGQDKFLGCIYGGFQVPDFAEYWNKVSPENAGKWGSVEGTRDVMNWTQADEIYTFAQSNNFPFQWHVLIWGNQQPGWIADLDSAEQRQEIEEWFQAIADRYDSLGIDFVEVVNEPLHDPPKGDENGGYIDALGGEGVTGWDWVIESFKLARKYFQDTTQLLINDYNIVNSKESTQTYIDLIELLQQDTLIDGIGVQCHAFSLGASASVIKENLDSLANTGLPIYVTELDVDGPTDKVQLQEYQRVFPVIWEHPAVEGITHWGYMPGLWRSEANLITEQGEERPALQWLRAYVNNTYIPIETINIGVKNEAEPVITSKSGTLQLEAEILPDTATISSVEWTVSDESVATINANGLITSVSEGSATVYASSLDYGSEVQGTIDVTIDIPTNIEETGFEEKIKIYPNPTYNGQFILEGIEKVKFIRLMDLQGRLINQWRVNKQSKLVSGLKLDSGIYLFEFIKDDGSVYQNLLVK